MQQLPVDDETIEQDRLFVIKKLGINEAEFETIMNAEPKTTWEYPTDEVSPPKYDAVLRWGIRVFKRIGGAQLPAIQTARGVLQRFVRGVRS